MSAVDFPSQSGEDLHLFNTYFHNMHDGFYLEMGALDGLFCSNTRFFEQFMGWRGLLIEPSPAHFDRLMKARPHDLCIRAAVCATESTVHFVDNTGPVNGIIEFMAPAFKAIWHSDIEEERREGHITAMPLQRLFDRYHIKTIEFWSLDVEGAELQVLLTVDFTAVHISVILVEADGAAPDKEAAVRALLVKNGFVSHGPTRRSEWFVNSRFQPHAAPNSTLTATAAAPRLPSPAVRREARRPKR